MIQWWRNVNRFGPILWIPFALIGFVGGGAALGFLTLAILQGFLQVTFGKTERLVNFVVVCLVWWILGSIASYKADPIKAFQVQIGIGWLCVAIAGCYSLANALMGH